MAQGGRGTRRDAAVAEGRATKREQGPTGTANMTRRDDGDGRRWTRFNLPPELVGEFHIIEELGSGGEAVVLRVADSAGEDYVAKLYFPELSFDEKASSLLAGADREHVVQILEAGTVEHDGSRYEIQEWCRYGSLRDQMGEADLELEDVVREVSGALEHIHGLRLGDDPDARLVHQDLKPENVFVRSMEPFDLVLGDFGLARMIAGSRHYTNRQQGSRAWAPPSGEAVSTGWDWWSLGIVIAELAAGFHPFSIEGQWLSDAAISDLLSQGPVDLSAISEPRVLSLCRGLLTRRTADRWGADEVRRWLAGDDVPVAVDGALERARRVVLFNEREFRDPANLALGLQQDWDQALEALIQRSDGGNLSQQVALLLSNFGLTDAELLLRDTSNPPTRLANLLVEMNDDLPPLYRGADIRPAALAESLINPVRGTGAVDLIENKRYGLAEVGVMSCWGRLQGMDNAAQLESRLKSAKAFLSSQEKTIDELTLPGPVVDSLKANVYAAALQPNTATQTKSALDELDDTLPKSQAWWSTWATDPSEYAPVLALHLEGYAREQTQLAQARVREEQRLNEERKVREADSARREQQERRVAERTATTVLRWGHWAWPLFVLGVICGWLGVGMLVFTHAAGATGTLNSVLKAPFNLQWGIHTADWSLRQSSSVPSVNWYSLRAHMGEATALGVATVVVALTDIGLGFKARGGSGISSRGTLSVPLKILTALAIVSSLILLFVSLPWTVGGLSILLEVVAVIGGVIAAIALAIFIIGSMLDG